MYSARDDSAILQTPDVSVLKEDTSFDLDLSLPKSKVETVESKINVDYVPQKGQKTAVKRLNKIKGKNDMHYTGIKNSIHRAHNLLFRNSFPESLLTLQDSSSMDLTEEKPVQSSKSKRQKQRSKRIIQTITRPQRRRVARQRAVEMDSSDYDSDTDEGNSNMNIDMNSDMNINTNRNRNNDPNVIYLDCDDEFAGGPEMKINRNLAANNSFSFEDNEEIKVSVKINVEVDQYKMRPVS